MSKVAILTDSGALITPEEAKKLGIYVVALQVIVDGIGYNEGVDISAEELFLKMKQNPNLIPTTSQPSPGVIIDTMEQIRSDGYDKILAISMGKGLSSTHDSLIAQAKTIDMDIDVISSDASGPLQNHLVMLAKSLLDAKEDVKKVASHIRELIAGSDTFMFPNDMNYFKKSGRITPTAAMLAGMLKIKPLLILSHELGGMADTFAKVRSMRKAGQIVIDYMVEKGVNASDYAVFIAHSLNEVDTEMIKEMIFERFENIYFKKTLLPATVGANLGVNGFGVQFIKKK